MSVASLPFYDGLPKSRFQSFKLSHKLAQLRGSESPQLLLAWAATFALAALRATHLPAHFAVTCRRLASLCCPAARTGARREQRGVAPEAEPSGRALNADTTQSIGHVSMDWTDTARQQAARNARLASATSPKPGPCSEPHFMTCREPP